MSAVLDTLTSLQDDFFDVVDRVEDPVLSLTETMAEAVADFLPERPALPFVAELPTMQELVENQIAFAKRLVDVQAEFARAWLVAMKPVTGKLEAKPARTRSPKRVAAAAPKAAPKAA